MMMELPWQSVRETLPFRSFGARTHWTLCAQEWLTENTEGGWTGIAYLDDGVVYVRFETPGDATGFRTACQTGLF